MITYAPTYVPSDRKYRVEVREITWNDSSPSVVYPSDRIRYSHWDAVRKAVEFISGLSCFSITAMREELGWYCESDHGDLLTVEIVESEV